MSHALGTATSRSARATMIALVLIGSAACATQQGALKQGDMHARLGEWDAAIQYYQQVLNDRPTDREARAKLLQAKTNASQFHRVEGNKLVTAGDLQRAQLELELAVRLDPTNQVAAVDLRRVNELIADARRRRDAERTSVERAVDRSMDAPSPLPLLEHEAEGLLTFDYRRARMREIYRALGRLGDINVLFDPDLDNGSTSFYLADVDYERALEIMTATHGHFYRVMSTNTIVIAPDNQQKRRQYSPQVMRTFYLSNAEAEQVSTALQTILQARQVVPNPALNAVTIRDSAELVEVAERIVRSLDKARGEVLLQVEIFELDRGVMDDYGLSLSDYGTTLSVAQGESGLAVGDLSGITNQDVFLTIPSLRYQFMKQNSSFRLIAQPQLRASDGQLSSLLVGEQRPVVSTTFNPSTTVGGNVVPISSTEYRDVGIVIDATPRVHHDGTITLQLTLQVTAVQEGSGAQNQPIFTARTLSTTLRLMEGETNLLAGLLRDDERSVYKGIPILSNIPLLRELFGQTQKEVTQTDIVLSITPYIVRMADITDEDLAPVYVGTENAISGGSGNRRRGRSGTRGDDDDEGEEAAPADPILVSLRPAEQSGSVGQTLSIDVTASGDADVNNAGMRVRWNPQVLRLIEATEGTLLNGDGATTSFSTTAVVQGTVAIGIGRVGDVGGVLANGVLTSLAFEIVGAGNSDVQIVSAALRDDAGRPLGVEFEQARVVGQED